MLSGLIGPIGGPVLRWQAGRLARRFEAATRRARAVQTEVLLAKLRRNAASRFGREHGFDRIDSVEAFRRAVPICRYEDIEPYIEEVKAGRLEALFGPGQRVHMFAMTSGTTARPKFVPVTDAFLDEYRRGWMVWGLRFFVDHPRAMYRPILQLVSSADEFRTSAGIPCGSISGLIAQMQRRLVRRLYCLPAAVGQIKDAQAKYYAALRLSLPCPVGYIGTANPNTLVHLARLGAQQASSLIRDLERGTLSEEFDIPPPVRDALATRIRRRHPRLARHLQALLDRHGTLLPRHYWPTLAGIGTWKGGTVGLYLPQVLELYGPVPVRDIGLMASEGRMTIPVTDEGSAGILDVTSHFFEFIPEEQIDQAHPDVLGCHELEPGRNYFILLTTSAGLYRYNIYDLVQVTGYYHEAPILAFLNKGAHISSLVGEKLAEQQVVEAYRRAARELEFPLGSFVVCPRWGDPPGYVLLADDDRLRDARLAERFVQAVDAHLGRVNVEYAAKRTSGRLAPLSLKRVPAGTWEAFDRRRQAASGGTAEQYKHPFLVTELDFDRRF